MCLCIGMCVCDTPPSVSAHHSLLSHGLQYKAHLALATPWIHALSISFAFKVSLLFAVMHGQDLEFDNGGREKGKGPSGYIPTTSERGLVC